MECGRVLIVDDDRQIRKVLARILSRSDCEVSAAATGEEAIDIIGQEYFDLVLTDINLPGISGNQVLKEVKRKSPSTAVIIMAGYGSLETAIQCIKLGADDFLQKPFDTDHLIKVVLQALERGKVLRASGESQASEPPLMDELTGGSRLIKELKRIIQRVAGLRNPLLISGEPGVGKKLIARLVHQFSARSANPFVVVNCAQDSALLESRFRRAGEGAAGDQPGFFDQANRGTLVLDEIGALDLKLQAQLLSAVERPQPAGIDSSGQISIDVRVIALTSRNLRQMADQGQFIKELYSLVSAVPIYVPPLREHIEDLPVLINHLLAKLHKPGDRKPNAASPEFLGVLENYDYPENVRELENIISHSMLLATGPILTPDTLPAQLAAKSEIDALAKQSADQDLNLKQAKALATERMESKLIRRVLSQSQGNLSMAARKLGISRSALYYKIRKYKIDIEQ